MGLNSRRNEDDISCSPSSGSLRLVQVSSCSLPFLPRTGAGAILKIFNWFFTGKKQSEQACWNPWRPLVSAGINSFDARFWGWSKGGLEQLGIKDNLGFGEVAVYQPIVHIQFVPIRVSWLKICLLRGVWGHQVWDKWRLAVQPCVRQAWGQIMIR